MIGSPTPLLSLDAVVLDTETTGLDAQVARIVQIGAIKIHGQGVRYGTFITLINPGQPIPPKTSEIHGIYDKDVEKAPRFADIRNTFEKYIGKDVVVGHNIGFDLAILMKEYERMGVPWFAPRALDVRVLARIAAPTLAGYSLDKLCAWLGIEIIGRHTAIGDAKATAQVFGALIPLLRQKNIRTLAEAEAACRKLSDEELKHMSAGWVEPVRAPEDPTQARRHLARIDSFPYRHRVRDIMSKPPAFAPDGATVLSAAQVMIDRKISSLFVRRADGATGIVTERDLLRAFANSDGLGDPGGRPITEIMSTPLQMVNENAFVYRAIGRMDRLGLRHLGVRNAAGDLVGAITPRNLLRQRASRAIALGDAIEAAEDAAALGTAWAKLPLVAGSLVEEEVDPRLVSQIISAEICAFTRQAARMAEHQLAEQGRGGPPVPYAVLVLGSAGRGESLLAADQDNAIVYAHGERDGPEDRWFADMATIMADLLDQIGIPLCKGGIMAKNPAWRHSVAGWHDLVEHWIRRSDPKDLLNVDIFFDCVPVHGTLELGEEIWRYAYSAAHKVQAFQKLLTELARDWRSPLSMLGNFQTDDRGRIDMKKFGLMPIFTGARVLSIRHDVPARSTPERLRGVLAHKVGSGADIEAIIEAHGVILGTILDQQLLDGLAGVPLSNKVQIDRLDKRQKTRLREAVRRIDDLTGIVGDGRI